ncbi:hypothetical protein CSP5_0101 [Cuniculiplasma divulgatum]|uniref:Uncharacterized protein n=1 Tax=Cuniculiplasma divulgatum TaxID=1673428 RepID=A0A1N5S6N6_9ARCH|nr:hypothetical protein [Cuniculiplasma sp.]SIM31664.1 hypothetical protein CSP5_0101 [Cuniculiplasma divulgatum]SJK83969.1 hypothetical protein CPM_0070 [Cuniculiplasma divulgatum]
MRKGSTDIPKEATFRTGAASILGNGSSKTDWTVRDEDETEAKVRTSQSSAVRVCQTCLLLLNMFSAKNQMSGNT